MIIRCRYNAGEDTVDTSHHIKSHNINAQTNNYSPADKPLAAVLGARLPCAEGRAVTVKAEYSKLV